MRSFRVLKCDREKIYAPSMKLERGDWVGQECGREAKEGSVGDEARGETGWDRSEGTKAKEGSVGENEGDKGARAGRKGLDA